MRKSGKIITNIFVCFVVAMAVCIMLFTIVTVNTVNRSDRKIFGYSAYIVMSDSMSKTDFDAGDVILIKEVEPSTLKAGDIIEIGFGTRNVKVEVLDVAETVRKEEAKELFRYL